MKIDCKKILEIFEISDVNKRNGLLELLTDDEKMEFGKVLSSEILKRKVPTSSPVVSNFIKYSANSPKKYFQRITIVEGMKHVINWLKNKTVNLQQVAESDEFKHALQILSNQHSSNEHLVVATDLIHRTILSFELKNSEIEFQIFHQILSLPLVFEKNQSKSLCKLFTSLGEKFIVKILNDGHYSKYVVPYILEFTKYPETAPLTFGFWRLLSNNLKSSKLKEEFCQTFESLMLNLAESLMRHKRTMDINGDDKNKYQTDLSKLIGDIVKSVNPQKAFERFAWILYHPNVSLDDAEIAFLFIEKISEYINPNDNCHVSLLVENILKLNESSPFLSQCIKILGNFGKWYLPRPEIAIKVLNFLVNALNFHVAIADVAAEALKEFCRSCELLVLPFIEDFFKMFMDLDKSNLSSDGQLEFIKALCILMSALPYDQLQIVLRELCKFQFEKISISSIDRAVKLIDQLVEVFDRIKHHAGAIVFVECWPILSHLMDCNSSEKVFEKIVEVLRSGVRSYGINLIPILEDMIEKTLLMSMPQTYQSVLKFYIEIFDSMNENFSNDLLTLFKAASTMTFNVMLMEQKFDSTIVEKFFEFANKFVGKFPLLLMQSSNIIPTIELAIDACTDTKDSNAIKFILTILKADNLTVKQYQRDIMTLYADEIILSLLHASMFIFPDTLKFHMIAEIFETIKNISHQGFSELISKNLYLLPNRKANGNIALTSEIYLQFLDEITRPNLSKPDCVTCLTALRKIFKSSN